MRLLLLLIAAISLHSTTVTVCASGCTYTNFQTALTATASDCAIDVMQLTAGETFSGTFAVPFRNCTGSVWVRSSRYAELPPVGTRVSATDHAALMPTINANVTNSSALTFYAQEANPMTAADLGTDVMTVSTAFATGTPFSCTNTPPPPMVGGTIYYAINVSGTTMQAALTPGGAAINITGMGSIGSGGYYDDPHCIQVAPRKNWRFTGLKITMPSGTVMQTALVRIGGMESNALSVPRNIWFDRNIIVGHGDLAADWPSGGIRIHGAAHTITDNWIGSIHCFSCEGKPILGFGIVGPVLIQNNFIGGGSIGILIGGDKPYIPNQVSNNITIRRNYFSRPGNQMYREGAGAPSGACYYGAGSGMFYRNTSSSGTTCSLSGRCYSCQSNNTWAIDLAAPYRADDFLVKNPIELKEGENVLVEGNIWEGQQASIDSQGNCIFLVAGASGVTAGHSLQNVSVKNNRCTKTWGGISVTTTSNLTVPSRNVSVDNNLATDLGSPQLLAANGGTGDSVFQMRNPTWQAVSMRHNTHRPDAAQVVSTGYGLFVEDDDTGLPAYALPTYIDNNLWWGATAGTRTGTGATTCNSTSSGWGTVFLNDGSKQVSNNVQFGTVTGLGGLNSCATSQNLAAVSEAAVDFASDSSLNTTSPYSASCASACAFAGTDGKDVGVDLIQLNTAISGVTAGTAGMPIQVALGSTRAIMRYTAPDSSACTVKLYTNAGRTTLATDTDSGPEQLDSRTGSVTNGTSRQVVLGSFAALTASTQYSFTATCGSTVSLAVFRTLSAGSGTYGISVGWPSAAAGEYSASADMSSPTAISSATRWTVPVASGAVVYYRATNGLITASVAR